MSGGRYVSLLSSILQTAAKASSLSLLPRQENTRLGIGAIKSNGIFGGVQWQEVESSGRGYSSVGGQ